MRRRAGLVAFTILVASCQADEGEEGPYPLSRDDPRAVLPERLRGLPVIVSEGAGPPVDAVAAAEAVVQLDRATGRITRLRGAGGVAEDEVLAGYRVDPGAAALGSVERPLIFGPDNRVLVTDTLVWPHRAAVNIGLSFPDGSGGWCTGTMIGRRSVLTAGHCLYNPGRGGFATAYVVPALDGTYMPFGAAEDSHVTVSDQWYASQTYEHDWGLVTIDRTLGDATGWLGLVALGNSALKNLATTMTGYPEDRGGGVRQYRVAGTVRSVSSNTITHLLDTMGGQSGSGMIGSGASANAIHSVHSGWFDILITSYNRATRLTGARVSLLSSLMTQDASLPTIGGDHTGWESLGGATFFDPAAVAGGSGRLDVFVLDGATRVIQHNFRDGAGWSGWSALGTPMGSNGVPVRRSDTVLDLFARGTDGALWTRTLTGASWSSWTSVGGSLADPPVAVSSGPDRVDVFARTPEDELLWYRVVNGTGAMSTLPATLSGRPSAASWGPGHIAVAARGEADQLVVSSTDGTAWSGWLDLGGVLTSDPALVASGAGRLDVFVRGTDAAVYWQRYDAGWGGFVRLGGSIEGQLAAIAMGGDVRVFVRGAFLDFLPELIWGPVYSHTIFAGGGSEWALLGGDVLGRVAVAAGSSGVEVFARGADNVVRRR
jgi:V8-like Glu-specific endopeptidase